MFEKKSLTKKCFYSVFFLFISLYCGHASASNGKDQGFGCIYNSTNKPFRIWLSSGNNKPDNRTIASGKTLSLRKHSCYQVMDDCNRTCEIDAHDQICSEIKQPWAQRWYFLIKNEGKDDKFIQRGFPQDIEDEIVRDIQEKIKSLNLSPKLNDAIGKKDMVLYNDFLLRIASDAINQKMIVTFPSENFQDSRIYFMMDYFDPNNEFATINNDTQKIPRLLVGIVRPNAISLGEISSESSDFIVSIVKKAFAGSELDWEIDREAQWGDCPNAVLLNEKFYTKQRNKVGVNTSLIESDLTKLLRGYGIELLPFTKSENKRSVTIKSSTRRWKPDNLPSKLSGIEATIAIDFEISIDRNPFGGEWMLDIQSSLNLSHKTEGKKQYKRFEDVNGVLGYLNPPSSVMMKKSIKTMTELETALIDDLYNHFSF